MKKRWLIGAAAGAVLAIGVAASLAASSAVPPPDRELGSYLFGPKMARAEVVLVVGGTVHDLRVDQGRLRASGPAGLEIVERDGTMQTVPVSPRTRVTLNGVPSSLPALRRGLSVLAVRDGDAPASIVRARTFPGR